MRALVVVAGISGLSAAGALSRNCWETTVLEQAPGPRSAGYMIDFFGPGFAAADALGALDHLRHYGQLYAQARYVDAAGRTRARLSMDSFLNAADGRFFGPTWSGDCANGSGRRQISCTERRSSPSTRAPVAWQA